MMTEYLFLGELSL